MYFCLLIHVPHNLFRDPSFVWLNINTGTRRRTLLCSVVLPLLCVLLVAVSLCVMMLMMLLILVAVFILCLLFPIFVLTVARKCSLLHRWISSTFLYLCVCHCVALYVARLDRDSCQRSNSPSQCRCVAWCSLIFMPLVVLLWFGSGAAGCC